MNEANKILITKTQEMIRMIVNMDEMQRMGYATFDFGEEYNRLRTRVKEGNPEDACVLPPVVIYDENQEREKKAIYSYSDIQFYCTQMYNLLA